MMGTLLTSVAVLLVVASGAVYATVTGLANTNTARTVAALILHSTACGGC